MIEALESACCDYAVSRVQHVYKGADQALAVHVCLDTALCAWQHQIWPVVEFIVKLCAPHFRFITECVASQQFPADLHELLRRSYVRHCSKALDRGS